ncbi:MAG: VPA1262 family N-terminal domain-containing protein [Planctomycetaceae bacterium]
MWLFYGYATRAEGLLASAHWRRHQITTLAGGVGLVEFQLAADDNAVNQLRNQLGHATTDLHVADNQTVTLRHGGLVFRPEVFSALRTPDPSGCPVSLSDQLTQTGAHWQLNPQQLVGALASHPTLPANEWEECLSRILRWISDSTGVDLAERDAGRLGNFEDMRYLCGSYDQPDGLRHRPEPATENRGASVVVWLERPLAAQSPLLVGCRLFNGHPRQSRTLLLNEVRRWPGAGTAPLRFTASEPISSYELCVWEERSGRLLAQQDKWVLRRIGADMAIADPARFVSTEWDRGLPGRLRRRVAAETAVTHEPLEVGGYQADPWVTAEDNKRMLLHQLGAESGAGRFFPAGDEHHVESMMFLARLMNRRGVQRVLIADPYLDASAVNALLVRVRDVPEVVLLSSHDQAPPAEPAPPAQQAEPENWWKGSWRGTACHWLGVIVDRCRQEHAPAANVEPTTDSTVALVAACNEQVGALPRKLSVVNVRSADGKGKQFHDRNVLVEFMDGAREVWSLTNSLSMVARRYPLLITLTDPNVGRAVAAHLAQLQSGQVAGRPDLQSDVLWEKPTRTPPQPPPAAPPPPRSPFQSEASILQVLAGDVAPSERLTQALNRGLLEPERGPARTNWRVPQPARAEVAAKGVAAIQSGGVSAVEVLRALGEWEYFGGLSERDYGFDATIVQTAEAALRAILSSANRSDLSSPLDLSSVASFPECFDELRHYVNANAPGDIEPRGVHGLSFIADVLWRLAPERLVAVAVETGGSRIPAWLATNIGSVPSGQLQALLQSGQPRMIALGITLFWDRSLPRANPLGNRIAALDTEMATAGIAPFDRFLTALAVCVPGSRSGMNLQQALTTFLGQAPTELDDASRDRLVEVLSPLGGFQGIVRVSAVACVIPAPAVAERLHTWVIERTLEYLHFRGAPVPDWDSRSPAWNNPEMRAAFAESYWRLHGTRAPERFVTDVLRRLNLRSIDAPLFPTRDYGSWSDQVTGLLWGLLLGVALVDGAPAAERPAALARIRVELIRCLAQFRPSVWHSYGDFHGLFASIVATISVWVDDAAADADRTAWDNLLLQPMVPEIWKLYAMLHSSRLTERHIGDLAAWAQDPASSASLCDLHRVTSTRSALLAALHDRKTSVPNVAPNLDAIEARFVTWWDVRYLLA